ERLPDGARPRRGIGYVPGQILKPRPGVRASYGWKLADRRRDDDPSPDHARARRPPLPRSRDDAEPIDPRDPGPSREAPRRDDHLRIAGAPDQPAARDEDRAPHGAAPGRRSGHLVPRARRAAAGGRDASGPGDGEARRASRRRLEDRYGPGLLGAPNARTPRGRGGLESHHDHAARARPVRP